MHFLQAINSDISVLIVCNKTGGTIKGDIKKNSLQEVIDKCRWKTFRLYSHANMKVHALKNLRYFAQGEHL
jgi:hypothetical protein